MSTDRINLDEQKRNCDGCPEPDCSSTDRRTFLQLTGGVVSTMLLSEIFPNCVHAADASATAAVASYRRQRIAKLSDVSPHKMIDFNYPGDGPHTGCVLLQLKNSAGGGIGDNQSIVAFNTRCTHMGGDVADGIHADEGVATCGEHLTIFDLTRHGTVTAGHATQSLPQVILEVDGDEIYATGVIGLIYGYHKNPT